MSEVNIPGPDDAFAVFDDQDSGCLSYGVEWAGKRKFVKSARSADAFDSLDRVFRFHNAVQHDSIVGPIEVDRVAGRVASLVYPWVEGTVLNLSTNGGSDKSGLRRFQEVPVVDALPAVRTILEAHMAVAEAGFVAVDLYDGSFLYDFDTKSMSLIDLDEYRPGPFTLTADRLPGSTRYMAPEEFGRGSMIDERTTVFNLGRTLEILLDSSNGWRGSDEQARVAVRATAADPAERFNSVQELVENWIAEGSTE